MIAITIDDDKDISSKPAARRGSLSKYPNATGNNATWTETSYGASAGAGESPSFSSRKQRRQSIS